jgi:hypothetical protein
LGVVWRVLLVGLLFLALAVACADACDVTTACATAESSQNWIEPPAPSPPPDGDSPCVRPAEFALFCASACHESSVGGEFRQSGLVILLRPERAASQGVTPAWLSGIDPLFLPAFPRLHVLLGVWLL